MSMNNGDLEKYRNELIELLQEEYALGKIDEEEFEGLLDTALNADSATALIPIERVIAPYESRGSKQTPYRPESDTLFAVFGGSERRGVWAVPEEINVYAVFGGIDLDLSQCDLAGETEINATCVFGGMEIVVPDNARVEVNCIPIFGGVENKSDGRDGRGPLIRITGLMLFGGTEIRTMNRKERKRLNRRR
jgi:hypothetical protein